MAQEQANSLRKHASLGAMARMIRKAYTAYEMLAEGSVVLIYSEVEENEEVSNGRRNLKNENEKQEEGN